MIGSFDLTAHAHDMLEERNISEDWVERILLSPAQIEHRTDGTDHYLGQIAEHGNRVLRVVVNPQHHPARIVTVFFDRRLGRKL